MRGPADAAAISGYIGSSNGFARAIERFAAQYAQQTEQDWRLFRAAIEAGQIEAHEP